MKNQLNKKAYFQCAKIVNFDENLGDYIKKISKYPILSTSEEKELANLIKKGDSEAKKKLVQSNLRLVFNVAKKSIHTTTLSFCDLIQEGNLGLMAAVDKFNPKLGYKFSTYAVWWIKQAMFKAISEQSYCMKIPVYIQETLSRYKKAKETLEKKYGCTINSSLAAREIGISEEKIDTFLNAYTKALSLETGFEKLSETTGAREMSLCEIVEDEKQNVEKNILDRQLKNDINRALECLKSREKEVITLRFGLNENARKTLEEIGNIYGVTKECIRQIEKRALQKINSTKTSRELLIGYII
ncbi:TPA: RNA polymerase sigma factor RpoD/SigA [Candidatus Galligastranaerophilus intestinavium]|uniref:RNA polymerase sigma factor n=1 Tax=Candidatus Galligastranaerophilus intestinavium TaxID=2840836 RepID=A0A9D1JYN9_9BACT|nr:RNA polymerase sigma factor RpoD/SigA [Candidatus Galligastranaerophilus intestinavium]